MKTYLIYPTENQEQLLEAFLVENNIPFYKEDQDGFVLPQMTDGNKRQGWEEAFRQMAENGDGKLLIPDTFKDEDIGS
jgi:hypothetical protein